jgi:hypothetical protein
MECFIQFIILYLYQCLREDLEKLLKNRASPDYNYRIMKLEETLMIKKIQVCNCICLTPQLIKANSS